MSDLPLVAPLCRTCDREMVATEPGSWACADCGAPAATADVVVNEVREDMLVEPWKDKSELAFGAPRLDRRQPETISCPCGDDHRAYPTAYGFRSECDELNVRWTSLSIDSRTVGGRELRTWVAEPYASMTTRNPKEA